MVGFLASCFRREPRAEGAQEENRGPVRRRGAPASPVGALLQRIGGEFSEKPARSLAFIALLPGASDRFALGSRPEGTAGRADGTPQLPAGFSTLPYPAARQVGDRAETNERFLNRWLSKTCESAGTYGGRGEDVVGLRGIVGSKSAPQLTKLPTEAPHESRWTTPDKCCNPNRRQSGWYRARSGSPADFSHLLRLDEPRGRADGTLRLIPEMPAQAEKGLLVTSRDLPS